MKDILLVSIIYHEYEIIKKHVDFLTTVSDRVNIILLENRSEATDAIYGYCSKLLRENKIFRYYLFHENIGMNAFETFFNNNEINLNDYKYVIVTDGDLTCTDSNWLDEEINILDKYSENTLCCGISLDLKNLPINLYSDAKSWIPKASVIGEDYEEAITGLHLLLFKVGSFINLLSFLKKKNLIFMDRHIHTYCLSILKKSWKRTLHAKAWHHTWDIYFDKNHPYSKIKQKSYHEIWMHGRYSAYDVCTPDGRTVAKEKLKK